MASLSSTVVGIPGRVAGLIHLLLLPLLLAMSIPPEVAHGSLRFSLGRDTTERDIDQVIKVLPPIVKKLRAMSPFGKKINH